MIKTTKSIIASVKSTLNTCIHGLEMVKSNDPNIRMSGLRNVIVFGRAITNILQNLRSTEPDFEIWYKPYVEDMKNNQVLKSIYEIRTTILKEGLLPVTADMTLTGCMNTIISAAGPKPPNAKGFFMGDNIGGMGWIITNEFGEDEKYYINIPSIENTIFTIVQYLGDSKQVAPETEIVTLSNFYIEYLSKMIVDAKQKFLSK